MATIDLITVDAPAAGYLFVTASVNYQSASNPNVNFRVINVNTGNTVVAYAVDRQALFTPPGSIDAQSTVNISCVVPVPGPGGITLRTDLFNNDFNGSIGYYDHNLIALYVPKRY